MRRSSFLLLVLLLIIALLAIVFREPLSKELQRVPMDKLASYLQPAQPSAPPISTFGPSKNRIVFAAGTVEGVQPEADLQFEIPGILKALEVSEGQIVRKGDRLASIDDSVFRASLAEAKATLELAKAEKQRLINGSAEETREASRAAVRVAEADLEQARRQLARVEQLRRRNAVADQDYDDAMSQHARAVAEHERAKAALAEVEAKAREDDLAIADSKIAVAEAKVEGAERAIEKTILKAPLDGVILQVEGEIGELISPNLREPLITMVDLAQLHVRAYVEELDAFRVQPGQAATIVADGRPQDKYTGTIVSCAPYMVPKKLYTNQPGERVDVKVREIVVRLEQAADLVIGLPVDVFIDPEEDADAVKLETAQQVQPPDHQSSSGM